MDVDITTALIAAFVGLIGVFVGAFTGIVSAYISHLSLRQKQEREIDAAEKRIEKEYQLKLDGFKKEQRETFKISYYEKQLAAYHKLWTLLAPAAYYTTEDEALLVEKEDGQYLSSINVEKFFLSFRDFFYSEDGILLSKDMRQAVFKVRDFILQAQEDGISQPDGTVKISNNQAKKINNGLDWIRKNIRRDAGLLDLEIPPDD